MPKTVKICLENVVLCQSVPYVGLRFTLTVGTILLFYDV